jgi:tRNA pseudouridine32 synthase/23S rRNA pseudouridine746 synthase
MKKLKELWKTKLQLLRDEIAPFEQKIEALTEQRAEKSAYLQQQLFEAYFFLNKEGHQKNLDEIFKDTDEKKPPAGAGECAAPKLLQYAFAKKLTPIALAEFWWGKSPQSEIRQHTNFYGACKAKCAPILAHMLHGIELDPNPLLVNPAEGKDIPIIYEDDVLLVVNKPAEFLSVPGKTISDSIYTRIKKMRPEATGPIIVHRLDMSTSGILVLTKTEEAYHHLQAQFIKRSVKKRYAALLDGKIDAVEGQIELPLRVDLNDRPRQMVCLEHGKKAVTYWKKITTIQEKTLVHFFPVTGRTHQLRVHSAHIDGLNIPIFGDDLYGKKSTRLFLHAEWISIIHPTSNKKIQFEIKNDFESYF